MVLFGSIRKETVRGKTSEYTDHCHPNLLMYKLLTSFDSDNEKSFVRSQRVN